MTTPKSQFIELAALAQIYLFQEYSLQQRLFADAHIVEEFRQYALTQKKVAPSPPTPLPPPKIMEEKKPLVSPPAPVIQVPPPSTQKPLPVAAIPKPEAKTAPAKKIEKVKVEPVSSTFA